jgi:sec-independent protein translocase protein TatB
MLEFSFWELALIAVIALLVVGPERLPELARQAGSRIGKAKRFVGSVRADIERELEAEELKRMLDDQQSVISELKDMISDTQAQINTDLQKAVRVVNTVGDNARDCEQPSASDQPPTARRESSHAPRSGGTTVDHGAKRSAGT